MRPTIKTLLAAFALASVPATAYAHIGQHDQGGFAYGFMHPMGGLDHVAAMVAVGVLAAQLGGRALWAVPCAFVGMMVAGGLLGFAGFELPFVEQGIGLSVVVLGALVAFGVKMPTVIAMGVVGLFAIFHGHAHGTELPAGSEPVEFAAGFVLATALLHAGGVALGIGLARFADGSRLWATRAVGAATAVFGVTLFVQ